MISHTGIITNDLIYAISASPITLLWINSFGRILRYPDDQRAETKYPLQSNLRGKKPGRQLISYLSDIQKPFSERDGLLGTQNITEHVLDRCQWRVEEACDYSVVSKQLHLLKYFTMKTMVAVVVMMIYCKAILFWLLKICYRYFGGIARSVISPSVGKIRLIEETITSAGLKVNFRLTYLSLVHSTFHDGFLSRSFPFVDTLVSSDVADTISVNLWTWKQLNNKNFNSSPKLVIVPQQCTRILKFSRMS